MKESTSNVLLEQLNKEQQEGVYQTDGPVLILAGAGSGKTRVLTNRTAYLIEERGVNPYHILAITFTNKAAAQMRERIDDMVGFGSSSIWVSTFHSLCVRILRQYADLIGYDKNFTIYDSDDQKAVVKDVCKRLEVDTKQYKERMFMSVISGAKNKAISPDEFRQDAGADYAALQQARVYSEYQHILLKNNAMDFDDLLLLTVRLFQREEEVLRIYQERFQYIMVDEYQDTNQVQFLLIQALAGRYKNLCVVGDDDQSIYKFRGADIRNILNFEQYYPDAKVIKLEQNYRSTQTILDAANGVILNNKGRKVKTLWTAKEGGDQIVLKQFDTAVEEASFTAIDIERNVRQGRRYNDFAVLYRTNAQSRLLEEKFVSLNIPYKVIGGVNFYSRREIKDVLGYLKTIANGRDDVAVKRIINVPKRGIGATSINKVQQYAYEHDLNFYDALRQADEITTLGRASAKLKPFVNFIQVLRSEAPIIGISKVIEKVLKETGYLKNLEVEHTIESDVRIENIHEFMSKAVSYEEEHEENAENPATLNGFLEEVALVAEVDSYSEDSNYVVLMTLHGAKGLEFPYVYMAGMEDGLFPSYMTITSDDPLEIEEERRLCYVGITRAKEHLTLMSARCRMVNGETRYSKVSRFVREVPQQLFQGLVEPEKITQVPKTETYRKAQQSFKAKPFAPKTKKLATLSYEVGDRVHHVKFGDGLVAGIIEGGRDFEVTVNFDGPGTKKMFATFAKLEKI